MREFSVNTAPARATSTCRYREKNVKSLKGPHYQRRWRVALIVTTLGGFAVRDGDGRVLALPTKKDRALLAYLIAARKRVSRERLATLLWGDRAEAQSRDSLRQSLAAIRRSFRPFEVDPLAGDREEVACAIAAMELDLDVIERDSGEAGISNLAAVYQGDFLPDFDGLSEQYDAWLLAQRENLRRKTLGILESLAEQTPSVADIGALRELAERMLAGSNTDECLYRCLMMLEINVGNRAQAVRIYRKCADALSSELGIEPEARTTELYRRATLAADPVVPSSEKSASADVEPEDVSTIRKSVAKRAMIAVMPFENISDDARLNYLCDGMAEEIITGLGRFPALAVFDRHSTHALSKKTNDVQEIGRLLGAAYIVHGSIMKSPGGMRITVRLIDAGSRTQRWANTYDCSAIDVLSVPEQVTRGIIVALHSWIEHSILDTTRRKPSLDAYESLLRGVKHLRGYGPNDNERALEFFEKAVALDPEFALARAYRAFADVVIHNYAEAPQDILDHSLEMARHAVELDETEGRCHWVLAQIYAARGDTRAEERHLRRAIELNANDANAIAALGACLATQDHAIEACALIEEAFRLNPLHPEWYWLDYSLALYAARRYEEAAQALLRRSTDPKHFVLARLAVCYAQMGDAIEARKYADRALAIKQNSDFTKRLRGWSPSQAEHMMDGYRKAGLIL